MPAILGLTGNIACGKTTVGLMLLELGATEYVDADLVVHSLYLPGNPLVQQIGALFGPHVLDADGGIDRKALGDIVFQDRVKLRQLEDVVHPAVQTALLDRLRALPPDGIGILDAIKLVESGYAPLCHGVWVVTCHEDVQMERLMHTRGLSVDEARARIAAQPPIDVKLSHATEVIENDGSIEKLRDQVAAAWQRFIASLPH